MKHIYLSIISLLIINIASAQFTIYGLGGLSGLNYKPEGGTQSSGIGAGAGMDYTFGIGATTSSLWGIKTGLEFATYSNKVTFGTLSEKYDHGQGVNQFRFSYTLNDYGEQQNVTMLSIPLAIQYQTGGSTRFYLSGGVKFSFPASARATITPGTVTTSGDFSHEQVEYRDLEQYGFVNSLKLPETKSDIDLGVSSALTLETGLSFALGGKAALYAGVFLDYGLNNLQSVKDKHVINYQDSTPSVFEYNSVLNTALIDKINLFSAGLKIKIALF
jgi:hypothetical protein